MVTTEVWPAELNLAFKLNHLLPHQNDLLSRLLLTRRLHTPANVA